MEKSLFNGDVGHADILRKYLRKIWVFAKLDA